MEAPTTRPRQAGIRENTDESCDLPKRYLFSHPTLSPSPLTSCTSNDILQHIAEAHRSRDHDTLRAPGRHIPSYGVTSTTHASNVEIENPDQSYDNIEAEIDSLKEDVLRLRQEADKSRPTPKTDQDLAMDKFLSTRSGRSMRHSHVPVQESAAARLQRMHETQSDSVAQRPYQTPESKPPGHQDFPALAHHTAVPVTPSNWTDRSYRRPSYAHAATSGMMDAISQRYSATQMVSPDSTFDSTSTYPASSTGKVDSSEQYRTTTNSTEVTPSHHDWKDDEGTVIMLRRQENPTSSSIEHSSPNAAIGDSPSGNSKNVPHFAQPTKSFARRTGETLRKDSPSSLSPKSSRESSPTKHSKDNETANGKRATQKRKSLPGEWTNVAEQPTEPKTRQMPTMIPVAKKSIKGKEAKAPSTNRQKNSYMAPTAAATQRNMVTLDSYKVQLDQIRKLPEPPLDGLPAVVQSSATSRPTTSESETSSVCFTADRSSGLGINRLTSFDLVVAQPPTSVTLVDQRYQKEAVSYPTAPDPGRLNFAEAHPVNTQGNTKPLPWQAHPRPRCESTASESPSAVSGVRNTTTKRRTSHSNLLIPIVARLEAQGLLKQERGHGAQSHTRATGFAFHSTGNGPRSAINSNMASPTRRSETRSDSSSVQAGTPAWRVMPPHLRRLQDARSVMPSTGITGHQEGTASHYAAPGSSYQNLSADKGRRDSVMSGTTTSLTNSFAKGPEMPTGPSLRATAEVFEPRRAHSGVPIPNDGGLPTTYLPDQVWNQLSPELREKILNLRAARTGRPWHTLANSRLPYAHASPTCEAIFNRETTSWQPPDHQHWPLVSQAPAPTIAQAGQTITPALSPGKKNVHWMLKDIEGEETPIKFGRAPPPSFAAFQGPSTPSMSSMSSNSSPPKTPSTAQGWRIGSVYGPRSYGWKGGDGKEISFIGYGPHAERDPSSVVGFDFRGTMANYSAGVSNGFGEDGENEAPVPFVVPRSQRQWAEKLGYTKVPCGNVEVTHGVEHMPFASQLAGYCYDCAGR